MASKKNRSRARDPHSKRSDKTNLPHPETKPAQPEAPAPATQDEAPQSQEEPKEPTQAAADPGEVPQTPATIEAPSSEEALDPPKESPPPPPEEREADITALIVSAAEQSLEEPQKETVKEAPQTEAPEPKPQGETQPQRPDRAPWRIALWLSLALSALVGDAPWTLVVPSPTTTSAPSQRLLFGQVTDEEGRPVANAQLEIGQLVGAQAALSPVELDAEGRFSLPDAPLGRYQCKAQADGYGAVSAEVVLSEKRPRVELFLRLPLGGSLAGRVIDAKGAPVPKAFVGASPEDAAKGSPRFVVADEQGNFLLENVARGPWVLFARTNLGLTSEPKNAASPGKDITLVIPNGSTIAGTFMDAQQNTPVPNARIRLGGTGLWPPRETSTDAQGQFRFAGIPAGFYSLIGTGRRTDGVPLYAASDGIEVKQDALRDGATLYANASWELRGEVTDESGRLLAGAEIMLSEDPFFIIARRAFSDASGHFSFEGVPNGDIYLRVLSDDLPPSAPQRFLIASAYREITAMPRPETPDAIEAASSVTQLETPPGNIFGLLVSAPRGQAVLGQVVNAEGRPVSGAYVLLRDPKTGEVLGDPAPRRAFFALEAEFFGATKASGDGSRFVTGSDGRFGIFGVREGDVVAVAQLPESPTSSALCKQGIECRVVISEAQEIKGRVVNEQGFPIADAAIRAAPTQNATWEVLFTQGAQDGTFQLAPVGGPVDIRVRATGYAPKTLRGVTASADLEIVLTVNDATLEGRVVDQRGFPISNAAIEISLEEFTGQTFSKDDGTFSFQGLPKGEPQLKVTHAGYAPTKITAKQEEVEVVLLEGGKLIGRVIDERGSPVYFAQIEVLFPDATSLGAFSSEGGFSLSELPPGSATLRVSASGYVTEERSITIKQGEEQEIEITLRQSGILRGKVVMEQGGNASGAKVRVLGPENAQQETTCAKDGTFFFSALPQGYWTVLVQKGSQGAKEEKVEIVVNETTRVNLSLEEGLVAIPEEPKGHQVLGMTLSITDQAVTVTAIKPSSIADNAGLLVGDSIESIDGAPTNQMTVEEVVAQLKEASRLLVRGKEGKLEEVELR